MQLSSGMTEWYASAVTDVQADVLIRRDGLKGEEGTGNSNIHRIVF